jgi:hypothetical protein
MPSAVTGPLVRPWLLAPLLLCGCGTAELQEKVARLQKDMLSLQNRLDRTEERVAGVELAVARGGLSTAPQQDSSLPVVKLQPESSPGAVPPTGGEPSVAAPAAAPATGPSAVPAAPPQGTGEPRPLIKIDGSKPEGGKKTSLLGAAFPVLRGVAALKLYPVAAQGFGPFAVGAPLAPSFGHNQQDEVGHTCCA